MKNALHYSNLESGEGPVANQNDRIKHAGELHRRAFFHRVALAAGGTLFTDLLPGALLASAEASYGLQNVAGEAHFPGYDLMLFVYGDIECRDLFLTPFSDLIPVISARVQSAVDAGIILQANADAMDKLLAMLETTAPNVTVRDMYLLDDRALANPADFEALRDICSVIDKLGLLLPFAYQQVGPNGEILESAQIALDLAQDESMVSDAGIGDETLRSLYTTPFIKDQNGRIFKGHARFRAITRAKMGGVFGPKPQMESDALSAFTSTYSGSMKGNSSACSQFSSSCGTGVSECCVPCANDEYYCAPDGNGECVAMSDVYDTTCA
jgi:hypothetical protein